MLYTVIHLGKNMKERQKRTINSHRTLNTINVKKFGFSCSVVGVEKDKSWGDC